MRGRWLELNGEWTAEQAAEFRERFEKAARDNPYPALSPVPYVCYSGGMTDEMIQTLKAKTEAVAALAKALSQRVDRADDAGENLAATEVVAFAYDWLSAMESMIPTPADD